MIKRLAVLRLASINLVYAKEPDSPVVLALFLLEPLSDPQLRHLAIAAPWNPVMIEVDIDNTWHGLGFGAHISVIETIPKVPAFHPRRRLKAGLHRRKRGFLFHD
jgi:hypothetical protein